MVRCRAQIEVSKASNALIDAKAVGDQAAAQTAEAMVTVRFYPSRSLSLSVACSVEMDGAALLLPLASGRPA